MSRIIVVGAGINGVTAAIELKKRGHKVVLVDRRAAAASVGGVHRYQ